ncbi:MAG: PH domain-containing protein [Actinomycetota bacterium]|nr:PH domain-containing protein [Actinomycetota bacterium]
MTTSDPFEVPGVAWVRLGPGLARLRRLVLGMTVVVLLAGVVAAGNIWPEHSGGWWTLAAVVVLGFAVSWPMVGRSVAAWGYAERADDLVVTRGALWRRIDLVPYGRLQMVDVHAGPMDRVFKLARVRLYTASPSTHAHIPGLLPAEAARLRDRLTRRGEEQAAGL